MVLIIEVSGECRLCEIDDSSVLCRCLVLFCMWVFFSVLVSCVCFSVWLMFCIIVRVRLCWLGFSVVGLLK